jgi:hypothetical protein
MDADSFSPGQEPCRKARPPLTVSEGDSPESTALGCLLFGYFLLGTQEKVTRPSADGRNARRAGEQSGDIARMKTEATG